ncbi:MAG: IPT/TIG domain-containing protein [Deltaproteobacteria bacterium]|nr:IPT/TIG domain-containing protein [Deltaproteobacteria bacterium]
MSASRAFLLLCCAHLSACGGTVSTGNDQAGNPPADASTEETGSIAPSCNCPAGQVWRNHACLSTLDIGCGQPCTAGVTLCGQYETCVMCAASSTCGTHDCLSTCSPTELHMGPVLPDSLRVVPTSGSAGASTEVTVYGFAWYIGALGYGVRVGSETIVEYGGGGDCAFKFKVPAHAPGRVPIFVSQYGSSDSWVLAGFFTYSAGDIDQCIQPGYPCTAAADCCSASDAPVSCTSGRCRAK